MLLYIVSISITFFSVEVKLNPILEQWLPLHTARELKIRDSSTPCLLLMSLTTPLEPQPEITLQQLDSLPSFPSSLFTGETLRETLGRRAEEPLTARPSLLLYELQGKMRQVCALVSTLDNCAHLTKKNWRFAIWKTLIGYK